MMKAVNLSTDTAAVQATAMFAVAIKFAGVGNAAIVFDEASIFSLFLIVSFRLAIRGHPLSTGAIPSAPCDEQWDCHFLTR